MILADGKIVSSEERDIILQPMKSRIFETLSQQKLDPSIVVEACHKFSKKIGEEHVALLEAMGILEDKAKEYLHEAKTKLHRDAIVRRLHSELGTTYPEPRSFCAENNTLTVTEHICPLGVLLHITAGNQHGLAFYSVIEGLLCGNINVVKVSGNDDGLSLAVLWEIIQIEPQLAPYIYLLDVPSSDTDAMKQLYDVADAVVVWGSDKAVAGVREMASPNMKIIEWGHRISFAYVAASDFSDDDLRGVAKNIIETNQLLCSSCQGFFVDTDSIDVIYKFCERFLPILDSCRIDTEPQLPLAVKAAASLRVYTESLCAPERPLRVFRGEHTSVIAYEDSVLEPALLYGNCWVRRLPRSKMVGTLRPYKGYLQTAALIAAPAQFNELAEMLWQSGVVRVTSGENMSKIYADAAHDGDYSLRRYTKIASIEIPK